MKALYFAALALNLIAATGAAYYGRPFLMSFHILIILAVLFSPKE